MTGTGLHMAVVEVTERCNLSCGHCYHRIGERIEREPIELSREDIDLIVRELAGMGCSYAVISGGEPLLAAPKALGLARRLKSRDLKVILTTNGILLGDFSIGKLECFDLIQVSLDGPELVHDALRGPGTFELALGGVLRLRDAGFPVSAMMTLSSSNISSLTEFLAFCRGEDIKLSVERMTPAGAPEKRPDRDEWRKVAEIISKEDIGCTDPVCRLTGLGRGDRLPFEIAGCTAGVAAVAVCSNLDVLPCVRIRRRAGNLRENRLSDIWERSVLFEKLRCRSGFGGKCGKCEHVWLCGGCRADALAVNGDLFGEDPLCWL